MTQRIRTTITSADPAVRDRSLDALRRPLAPKTLLGEHADVDSFRRGCGNFCGRVRALFLPYALHRLQLPARADLLRRGRVPFEAYPLHGGMAQNIGPILEMVAEKYLLRSDAEWAGRGLSLHLLADSRAALRVGDVRALGGATTRKLREPLQTIIPWASNFSTEALLKRAAAHFGVGSWVFLLLGGMSPGGLGFLVAPQREAEAQKYLQGAMSAARRELQHALPFALQSVTGDFAINERGTRGKVVDGEQAPMPASYYGLQAPRWPRQDSRQLPALRREEFARFGAAGRARPKLSGFVSVLFDRLPRPAGEGAEGGTLEELLRRHGFAREQHERMRAELKRGRIGLAQNRLPADTVVEDVRDGDVTDARRGPDERHALRGREALAAGAVAVVTLAAGAGSRWTHGAGAVKALHPFCTLGGRHRTFLEIHLAKSRKVGREHGVAPPHVITTGYLTHGAIAAHLAACGDYSYPGLVRLSPGQSVGLRLVPTERDLRFAWEQVQQLDGQAQRVRDRLRAARIAWVRQAGEGSDYTDNVPLQCLHPAGHWYEVPNLLLNGTLAGLLVERPGLRHLLVHNVDTLGATVDPALLGLHIESGRCLNFEVIPRRPEDQGGGLARVDGRLRLVEGLALPRAKDQRALSFYNTLTTWVDIDGLLAAFGLRRGDLGDAARVAAAVERLAARAPTYLVLKEVKKRWGHGQEEVFPVCQLEKLWGDVTAQAEFSCGFLAVPRPRGQQLKDPDRLDGWLRGGSAAHVEALCAWH